MMKLTQCCCGCSLKIGTSLVAVITMILSALTLIVCLFHQTAFTGYFLRDIYVEEEDKIVVQKVLTAITVLTILRLVISLTVLYGVVKEMAQLLLPWLMLALPLLVFEAGVEITLVAQFFDKELCSPGVHLLFGTFVSAACSVYSWLVVYSFFQQLKKGYQSAKPV